MIRIVFDDLASLQPKERPNGRALPGGFDIQPPAQLFHSLPHSRDSNTQRGHTALAPIERSRANSLSFVADLEPDFIVDAGQENRRPRASGMAMHVCQAFLHDAE
jgi:hypothetical protein